MPALRNSIRLASSVLLRRQSSQGALSLISGVQTCLTRQVSQLYKRQTKQDTVGNIRKVVKIDEEIETDNSDDKLFDRNFATLKVEDFEELYQNDREKKASVEETLQEYEYMKYNSLGKVPSTIDLASMEYLITQSKHGLSRVQIFNFLFKREMTKLGTASKKAKLREYKEQLKQNMPPPFSRAGLFDENGDLAYGLWHNCLFSRLSDSVLKLGACDSRLRQAAQFGPKLVFDFGFESHMKDWVYRNAIDQVQVSYGLNKFHYQDPFDLWFCNFDPNSPGSLYTSKKAISNLYDSSWITTTSDCFTKHFDRSKIVYLSPDATKELERVDLDEVYVIAVFNDKGSARPLSYKKAKSVGVETRKLPLDSNMAWHSGTKSLCLNHVTGILLECVNNGGNWREAMAKHIPKRKVKSAEMVRELERQKDEKYYLKRANYRLRKKPEFDYYK